MRNKWKFFVHYNKPASVEMKRTQWSVHFRGTCYIAGNVVLNGIPAIYSRSRKTQPRAVLGGYASSVTVDGDVIRVS